MPGRLGNEFIRRLENDTTMNSDLTRWKPLHDLQDFQNRLLSSFASSARRGNGEESVTLAEWGPLVDIAEDDKEYLIVAELPQVSKDDVRVTVENGVLTIAGERKFEKEDQNKKWHRVERAYGSFARTFALPEHGDVAKVKAEFKDGLLKIRVAKSEAARPRQIQVEVT
jgi:HSP20 family protein